MRKYSILLVVVLQSALLFGQSYTTKPPVHFPTAASVWEFTKYGEIGVSEYKGLANISIPLYNVSGIPLQLNYYSGGIKVSEEASQVGLGWSFTIPTIIQSVKHKNDYNRSTRFAKLPPIQGNPYMLNDGVYPTGTSSPPYSIDVTQFQSLPGYQNIPYYFNSLGSNVIDHNGYYNVNWKYENMIVNDQFDTEPDIFSLNLNGVEIKFCRGQSNQSPSNGTFELMPLEIINGRTEYKVELIPKAVYPTYGLVLEGIKIIDPSGNIYFFQAIDLINSGGLNTSVSYKLTKIFTNVGEQTTFNYSNITNVAEIPKYSNNYVRRTSSTTTNFTGYYGSIYGGGGELMIYFNAFYNSYDIGGFNGNSTVESSYNINSIAPELNYNYNYLVSINSPKEKIVFDYGDRLDFPNMKKLEKITIKNIFEQVTKTWHLEYDYFESPSSSTSTTVNGGGGVSYNIGAEGEASYTIPSNVIFNSDERFKKRLKLVSVIEDANNPYLFEYDNTLLPKKNSTSIDYWGHYNGHANINFKPNLSQLGYPSYTENSVNDFNANLSFCKAATLVTMIYPTKGYTVFNYELNQFDNLLFNNGSNTPIINSGAGLRIKEIANYNHDAVLINKKKYSYFDGKSISKRMITFEGTERWAKCAISTEYTTQFVSANINNYLNSSEDAEGDYIGYSRVEIVNTDAISHGKIEKVFSNNENSVVKLLNSNVNNGKYYSNRNHFKNGTLLNENIYNGNGNKIVGKTYNYFNQGFANNWYGMGINSNGLRVHTSPGGAPSCNDVSLWARKTLTFYPIYDKTTFLSNESITEYFNGNSKTLTTTYTYDNYHNVINSKKVEIAANLAQQVVSEETTNYVYSTSLNQFSLPSSKVIKQSGTVKEREVFTYEPVNGYQLLTMIESYPNGDNSLGNRKLYYDLYDDKNNILQYHQENGIYTSIIWGYNKTLPVAKLENIPYSNISQSIISQIQAKSDIDIDSTSENDLKVLLNGLRTSYPNAIITTYTHNPLVGVTTITDSKNDSVTYAYDASGRLESVKDKSGNILSENQYNYKP